MKKLIVAIVFVSISINSFGQNVNRLIKKKYVERIIKTLSADDMQGRATFTPGIEKAAKFIEKEFKTIGLKPMEGNSGFRQNFSMIHTTPTKVEVSINGVAVSDDHIAALTAGSFSWNTGDAEVVKIAADQDFRKAYSSYAQGNKKYLLIVDPKSEALFKRLHDRAAKGRVSLKKEDDVQPLVLVLGTYDDVKSYKINVETKVENQPLFNIAGIIPGKTKPDEFVIFSGHYDHLGIIKPMQGDSIANGADDDASGTTAVISLVSTTSA